MNKQGLINNLILILKNMKYLNEDEFSKNNMFWKWGFNEAYKQYFSWKSFLNFLVKPGESPLFLANVNFEPWCRNNWHAHHAKTGGWQILICTAWEWWLQLEWQEAQELKEWSIWIIPPNVKHWHGAKKDSWFSHVAIEIPWTESSNEWFEKVDDEHYDALHI